MNLLENSRRRDEKSAASSCFSAKPETIFKLIQYKLFRETQNFGSEAEKNFIGAFANTKSKL